MYAYEVVRQHQREQGISTAKLSRMTGITYDHLRRSLQGKRRFGVEEMLVTFHVLGISIDELADVEAKFPREP